MPKTIQVRSYFALKSEHWRVLTALEIAMKQREYVDLNTVHRLSSISHNGGSFVKILRNDLIPARVIAYNNNMYRLTNLGYDYLALNHFLKRGVVSDLSNFQLIGTGKESDIYLCKAGHLSAEKPGVELQSAIVLKFHRLGRTSFKQVKNKREYQRGHNCSWNHLNRISSAREHATMTALYNAGLAVPVPLAHNRGAVAMEFVKHSYPLFKFAKAVLRKGAAVLLFKQAARVLVELAELGLVHGDLNEFNLLVETEDKGEEVCFGAYEDDLPEQSEESEEEEEEEDDEEEEEECNEEEEETNEEEEESNEAEEECNEEEDDEEEELVCPYMYDDIESFKIRVIDFPQTISRHNESAQEIYTRDRQGLIDFFSKFTDLTSADLPPVLINDIERLGFLDVDLKAPGYPRKQEQREWNVKITEEKAEDSKEEDEEETFQSRTKKINERVEKNKQHKANKAKYANISKQQRNSKKDSFRNDVKFDF